MDVVINNSVDIDRVAQISIPRTGIFVNCEIDLMEESVSLKDIDGNR
jgi:hypothetical protein